LCWVHAERLVYALNTFTVAARSAKEMIRALIWEFYADLKAYRQAPDRHRKVSGTTRSDHGRDCRDAFLGLAKTCRKLGISFWDYLGTRLGANVISPVLPLSDIIANRCTG